MLTEDTISKLRGMKLPIMAQQYNEQITNQSFFGISFEDRVGMMVDAEWSTRKSNRLTKLVKDADFDISKACIEDIVYHPERKLDRTQIMRLSNCEYITEARSILILGATGVGKTYLACALGVSACRNFYSVKYVRLPELLAELAYARASNNYRSVIQRYQKVKLLIIDDWLIYPMTKQESYELLEIVVARHNRGSSIFCSQFSTDGWHATIGNEALADAVCDRIVNNSYKIVIAGDSMRKRSSL